MSTESETTILPREENVFAFLPSPPLAEDEACRPLEGPVSLRAPTRLVEILRSASTPVVAGPVLVSEAGSPLEEALPAIVYPLASMTTLPAPGGQRLEDELLRFCVGRTSANDIVVDDLSVSKRHASIVRHQNERWSVVDDGSTNGTFLDGRQLPRGAAANLGVLATLRFGPRARFVFMRPAVFSEYLASLRAEVERRRLGNELPSPLTRERGRFDRVFTTSPGGTLEPLAARIIARLRTAPAASAFHVELDDSLKVEAKTLSEVIALVERSPQRVLRIEATLEDGTLHSIHSR